MRNCDDNGNWEKDKSATFALQAACWSTRGGHTATWCTQGAIIIINSINIIIIIIGVHKVQSSLIHYQQLTLASSLSSSYSLWQGGAVYKCSASRPGDCSIIPFDTKGLIIMMVKLMIFIMVIRTNDGANRAAIRQ